MTLSFGAEKADPKSLISETEELYRIAASEMFAVIQEIRSGEWDAKKAVAAARDLRAFLLLVLEERTKVARFSKHEAGVVYDYALDFDAARTEIGRRLARLRDAGGG
jgi:hypothetical protein